MIENTMDFADSKRTRKPISYAVLDCSDDDDFSEYTPPIKKKKDDEDQSEKPSSMSDKSKVNDKDKSSSSQESSSTHFKEKDREKRRDKEKDEKRRDRDRDKRDSGRDRRDKDKDKDRDRHRKKDKHHDKERSRESKDKSSSEEERHKSKKDKKHDRKDKERENKNKEVTKKVVDEDIDPDFKESNCFSKSNCPPLTSTQKSPVRSPPRKRLTVEERLFQRELEAVIAISKIGTCDSTDKQEVEADVTVEKKNDGNSSEKETCNGPDVGRVDSKDLPKEEKEDNKAQEPSKVSASSDKEKKEEEHRDVTPDGKMSESYSNAAYEMVDPQPSTSTGRASKRQRKQVAFFEESDSESFDGFGSCGLSEESDFTPSPVKKKAAKAKELKKTKPPKSPKSLFKEQSTKSSPVKPPVRANPATKQCVKENTVPVVNGTSSPRVSSSTVSKPPEIKSPKRKAVIKSAPRTPELKPKEKTKIVGNNNTPSRVGDVSKIGVVKVPFRSPIQSSSTATPNFVPKSPNPLQRIGVRLGLSRKNFKPLHPGAVSK